MIGVLFLNGGCVLVSRDIVGTLAVNLHYDMIEFFSDRENLSEDILQRRVERFRREVKEVEGVEHIEEREAFDTVVSDELHLFFLTHVSICCEGLVSWLWCAYWERGLFEFFDDRLDVFGAEMMHTCMFLKKYCPGTSTDRMDINLKAWSMIKKGLLDDR